MGAFHTFKDPTYQVPAEFIIPQWLIPILIITYTTTVFRPNVKFEDNTRCSFAQIFVR